MNELYEIKMDLKSKIENYFGDKKVFEGDLGYQELLYVFGCVEERIEELESE